MLNWVQEPGFCIPTTQTGVNDVAIGDIVRVLGGYRLYYSIYESVIKDGVQMHTNTTYSAFSENGRNYTSEGGVRLDRRDGTEYEQNAMFAGAFAVNNGVRLYFAALDGLQDTGFYLMSAIAPPDGLNFTVEPGRRLGVGGTAYRYYPSRVYDTGGGYRIYVSSRRQLHQDSFMLRSAVCGPDGLNFTLEPGFRYADGALSSSAFQHPTLIKLRSGVRIMGEADNPDYGDVESLTAPEGGLNFTLEPGARGHDASLAKYTHSRGFFLFHGGCRFIARHVSGTGNPRIVTLISQDPGGVDRGGVGRNSPKRAYGNSW